MTLSEGGALLRRHGLSAVPYFLFAHLQAGYRAAAAWFDGYQERRDVAALHRLADVMRSANPSFAADLDAAVGRPDHDRLA
jgi:hypothetical protein